MTCSRRWLIGLVLVSLGTLIQVEGRTIRSPSLPITDCTADITFVIDNSGSIRDSNSGSVDNWSQMLEFMKSVVDRLDVSPTTARIAAVDFGNAGRLDFNLENYTNKVDVKNAIGRIGYLGENTNLTGGLLVARTQVYQPSVASRPDVNRVMVVITDGVPTRDVEKLDAEVDRIKAMGIRIIALGVTSKVDTTTLQRIVTSPFTKNYFYVGDFSNLENVVDRLTDRTCNGSKYDDTPETVTTARPAARNSSRDNCSVDVTFVIDNSGSIRDSNTGGVDNWRLILDFVKAIVNRLDVSPDVTRVAAVDFANAGRLDFDLGRYANKYDVMNAIESIGYLGENTNLTGGLKVAKLMYLSALYNRPNVDRVMVVITDGVPTRDVGLLDSEVATIKSMGIRIIALGVTNKVDTTILRHTVTSPFSQNYFYVRDYSNLDRVVDRLSNRTCNIPIIIVDPIGCKLDLAIVIDASGSINWDGWYSALDMAKRLVQRLPVGVNQTRVAVVVFSVGVHYEIRFSDHQTSADIVNAIGRLRYYGGHSDLDSALRLLPQNVFVLGPTRYDSFKAAVLITDGDDTESSDADLVNSAAMCEEYGIQLFAVGITQNLKRDRLRKIVSQPGYFYEQSQFQSLSDYLNALAVKECLE